MSNVPQQANFFEFPQQGADLSHIVFTHPYSSFLPPLSPYQLCELIYTPVNTPNGLAMTPSLIPISTREGSLIGTPVPSLMPSPPPSFNSTLDRSEEDLPKGCSLPAFSANFVNGIPAAQWKSMTDNEREDFLKLKRRQEAFKTALCQGFMKCGDCKYGDSCRFAHGNDDLRLPKYNHPKYKTVLCRTYAVAGECPYGSRCQFIHEKFHGHIPTDFILSIESTQETKSARKTRSYKNIQFSEEDKEKSCLLREGKSCTEVREAKKKLQCENEKNNLTDLTETFDKMFDAKKFFSRSCKPRLGI